jgi:hypothetical protein
MCDYIILHNKWEFAGVIMVKVFHIGNEPMIIWCGAVRKSQYNKSHIRRRTAEECIREISGKHVIFQLLALKMEQECLSL